MPFLCFSCCEVMSCWKLKFGSESSKNSTFFRFTRFQYCFGLFSTVSVFFLLNRCTSMACGTQACSSTSTSNSLEITRFQTSPITSWKVSRYSISVSSSLPKHILYALSTSVGGYLRRKVDHWGQVEPISHSRILWLSTQFEKLYFDPLRISLKKCQTSHGFLMLVSKACWRGHRRTPSGLAWTLPLPDTGQWKYSRQEQPIYSCTLLQRL